MRTVKRDDDTMICDIRSLKSIRGVFDVKNKQTRRIFCCLKPCFPWGKQIFRIFPCYEVHSPNRSEILQSPQSGTLHRINGLVSEGCPICFFPTCYIRILVHHRPRSQPEPLHNDKYHSTRGIPSQIDCAKERHSSDTRLCLQRPGFPSRIFPNLFPICIELLIDSLAFLGSWSSKR